MTRKILSISTLHCAEFGIVTTITTDDGGIWEYCAGAWHQLPPIPALPEPESPKQRELFDKAPEPRRDLFIKLDDAPAIKALRPLAPGEMEARAFSEITHTPWYRPLHKLVGTKLNRGNWSEWADLVKDFGVDRVVDACTTTKADFRWPDRVRDSLAPIASPEDDEMAKVTAKYKDFT